MTQRPVCGYCGKAYGARRTHMQPVRHLLGKPVPPYMGNGKVIREREHTRTLPRKSLEAIQRTPMTDWEKSNPPEYRKPGYVPDQVIVHREVWLGEWWGGYEPFCTMRCALEYARRVWLIHPLKRGK